MSDTTNDAAFEDAYRSGALLREALRNLGQANHDEGPPLWRGLITATIPPQDPMDKPTERAPLLSDEEAAQFTIEARFMIDSFMSRAELFRIAVARSRDFYEAKITSGELRVVKKAKVDASIPGFIQCSCGVDVRTDEWQKWNFCPGCGASITK